MFILLFSFLLVGISALTIHTSKNVSTKRNRILVYIFFSGIVLFATIPISQALSVGEKGDNFGMLEINLFTQWVFILIGIRLLFIKEIYVLFRILVMLYIWFVLFSYILWLYLLLRYK